MAAVLRRSWWESQRVRREPVTVPEVAAVAGEPSSLARRGPAVVRLALPLSLAVIGWEQALHQSLRVQARLPVYYTLHWLSDSLLALPLAAAAVWGGYLVAGRLGLGRASVPAAVGRAYLIALLFALLLVPGAALHDAADRLTHVHVGAPVHSHGVAQRATPVWDVATFFRFAGHALVDGAAGQEVGLPLVAVALLLEPALARRRRRHSLPAPPAAA